VVAGVGATQAVQQAADAAQVIGQVVDLIETGANDVYVVRGATYGEVLIPAIDSVVLSIDPDAHRMIIDPMPGLLPDPLVQAEEDEHDDRLDDTADDDPA